VDAGLLLDRRGGPETGTRRPCLLALSLADC